MRVLFLLPLLANVLFLRAAACVSVGPFIDPAHAAAANAQLERLGFTSRRRVSQDEVRVGYWVRVPNLATPADATNALVALRAAGLGDAYVVAEGEPTIWFRSGCSPTRRRAAEVSALVPKAGFAGNQRSPAAAGSTLARHRPAGERRPAVARGAGRASRRAARRTR
ncbi:MAG: SPOR domain-containing protein [Proteobacteria bacterium]|nr:SPOR domain-containing protein [Pseudomonadota bacterium]